MCFGGGPFASILLGTQCASWTCMSISFTKLGKFPFITFSNRFLISCSSSSSPSGTPMMRMLEHLKLSQRLFTLSLFFRILFSSSCPDFLLPYVPNHWFDPWFNPLYCCSPINCSLFQLVYPSFLTGYFLCCRGPHSVPWACLWTVFWTLHLTDSLSPFCLVPFLEFWSVLSFGPCFFDSSFWQAPCVCFYI